jgi:hypothetical protein
MIKPPFLLVIDCKTGAVRRYVRMKDWAVAGRGWQLKCVNEAQLDLAQDVLHHALESFRVTGR